MKFLTHGTLVGTFRRQPEHQHSEERQKHDRDSQDVAEKDHPSLQIEGKTQDREIPRLFQIHLSGIHARDVPFAGLLEIGSKRAEVDSLGEEKVKVDLSDVMRPGAEPQVAGLVVERKSLDVDGARAVEHVMRVP